MLFPPNDSAGAIFSDCRLYRYRLWRVWDASKPAVAFCMLNPSTADEDHLDPTLKRCLQFAKDWGFGRMDIVNLFAWRSTDPKAMKRTEHPESELDGFKNNNAIADAQAECNQLICAWGVDGAFCSRGSIVKSFLKARRPIYHLGLTKEGFPRHPLYTLGDLKPILWE